MIADVVIDTNIVIWYFAEPQSLSPAAVAAADAAEANGAIYVLAIMQKKANQY